MTRYYYIFLLLSTFCCASPLTAQVKKGLKYLTQNNYSAARTAFLKHRQHRVYAPLANYGIVKSDFLAKEPSLESICGYTKDLYAVLEGWYNLPIKRKKKLFKRFQFDTASIKALHIELENRALTYFHDSSGILVFEKYIQQFPNILSRELFFKREDLRKRMVNWHLKSVRRANYAILDALYNRHADILELRGSRYPDYVYSFILDAFLKEHTYRNMVTFIQEQPNHWFSEACWSSEAAAVLKQNNVQVALGFLWKYPYFILDDWIDLHINRLTSGGLLIDSIDYTPLEWKQLQELRLGWDLDKQLRSGKRNPGYDTDLMRYLEMVAPAKRGYDLFRMALSAYQRREKWDQAIQLLQKAQQLYPDGVPPGCEKSYPFYTSKEEWFGNALEVFRRPADGIHAEFLPGLGQPSKANLSPVFAPDGQSMYLALDNGETGLDVFVAHYDAQKKVWAAPQKVETLSSPQDDRPYSITSDGRDFLLAQGGKLMMSTFGAADWQKPFGLPLTVNNFSWLGRATLSPDGRCLVFEGSGNKKQAHEEEPPHIHLYRMVKGESRFGWANPVAMAKFTVMGGKERSPSFGPDGKLYFIADRWPSLGQGDIFVSQPLNNEWNDWTDPQNLGKEINTLVDEKHWMSIAPDNSHAVFCTNEWSKNDEYELYRIELPSIAKPEKYKILILPLGTLGQQITGYKRREMLLQIRDAQTGQLILEVKPQGESRFIASLPATVQKLSYQVLESSKTAHALTKTGAYTLSGDVVQYLPPLESTNDLK